MIDEQLDETLSALVDGELPRAQVERVLDRLLADDELRERWRRHHLLRAALSTQHSLAMVDDELAARVSTALEAEAVPTRRAARRFSWTAGLAVAASAAVVAVLVTLGVSTQQASPPGAAPSSAVNSNVPAAGGEAVVIAGVDADDGAGAVPHGTASAPTRMAWNDARPAVEERLNSYLLNHNEYLADGVRGMLPYARVVGYDARN